MLEIGAGIGQIVEELLRGKVWRSVTAVEPDANFANRFRERLPKIPLHACTTSEITNPPPFDTIVCINVLERIRDDVDELKRMRELLRERQGQLSLFITARPEIYAPIDKDFGHWRRYTRKELVEKLTSAGHEILAVRCYNFPGCFAWWLIFKILENRRSSKGSVQFHDKVFFPITNWLERVVMRPPIGQSLFAVARAKS